MRRAPLVLIGAVLLFAGSSAWAEDVSLHAEVESKKVGVDDQFHYTVTISGRSIDLKGEIDKGLASIEANGAAPLDRAFVEDVKSRGRQRLARAKAV